MSYISLVPSLRTPLRNNIFFWAYSPKVVITNESARSNYCTFLTTHACAMRVWYSELHVLAVYEEQKMLSLLCMRSRRCSDLRTFCCRARNCVHDTTFWMSHKLFQSRPQISSGVYRFHVRCDPRWSWFRVWNQRLYLSIGTFFEQHEIFWTLLGDTVTKVCASKKKFGLVHQTVSPHKRVGSGDETRATFG